MISNYLGQFPPLAFAEGNEGINNLILFDPTYQKPTYLCPIFCNQIQEEEKGEHDREQQQKQESSTSGCNEQYFLLLSSLGNREQGIGDLARDQTQEIHKQHEGKMQLTSGSSEDHLYRSTSSPASEVCDSSDDHGDGIKHATWKWGDQDNGQCQNGSIERMQTKMKLVKKMINSDGEIVNKTMNNVQPRQIHRRVDSYEDDDRNNTPNISIRVCADCNTTKTPLWRSGPRGPKSLCNACGIRQRKARRAMAAAAASGELTVAGTPMKSNKMIKAKRSNGEKTRKYKKRCKATDRLRSRKLKFDDFKINLSKKLAFHQMFPQDEKEAAILLMALSCDLICG